VRQQDGAADGSAAPRVAQVTISRLSKRYGGVQALRDVSFAIRQGAIHALLGENGAGKSTLVKILSGAVRPDAGSILVRGQPAPIAAPQDARRFGISVVHQELSLFPDLTVLGNVFAGREVTGRWGRMQRSQMLGELRAVMDAVGWWIDPDAPVGALSLGARQMVEILRAFHQRADLIVLDEPNSALTDRETQALFDLMRRMRAQGRSFLLVSHRLDEVFAIADDVTVLRDGQHMATVPRPRLSLREAVSLMVGENRVAGSPVRAGAAPAGAPPVLRLVDVTAPGLARLSLDTAPGEILGFAGLEGSGVQELFGLLFGRSRLRQGAIFLAGTAYAPRSPRDAIRAGLASIPADRRDEGLLMERSVGENAALVILDRIRSAFGFVTDRRIARAAAPYLATFHVRTPSLAVAVTQLSGGNQQKVVLAKWLAAAPRVLLLNDPTRGVDVAAKREVHNAVKHLADDGITIWMWSSDAAETLELCDRVLVLSRGRRAGEFRPATTTLNQLLLAMFGDATTTSA